MPQEITSGAEYTAARCLLGSEQRNFEVRKEAFNAASPCQQGTLVVHRLGNHFHHGARAGVLRVSGAGDLTEAAVSPGSERSRRPMDGQVVAARSGALSGTALAAFVSNVVA